MAGEYPTAVLPLMLSEAADTLSRCETELRVILPILGPQITPADVAEIGLTIALVKRLIRKFKSPARLYGLKPEVRS